MIDLDVGPRPTLLTKVLEGVRYSAVWNKRWEALPRDKWGKKCLRIMSGIPRAFSQPQPGVRPIDPVRRMLEDEGHEVYETVVGFCSVCHMRRDGFCKGVDL